MNNNHQGEHSFIAALKEIILSNISNENFGVKELAQAANMNYFHLNRKLHTILNKNTSQLIRETRLQFAKEMLEKEEITAAEVAYKAGFGSPAYFNKCFHEYFGYPPGEFKKKVLNEQPDNIHESALTPNPLEDSTNNLHKQLQIRKKLNRKSIIFASAGVIILALFSVFFFPQILKNTIPLINSEDKSIAVLPFKNLSDAEENQYFADGIMEEILNILYRIGEFRVVSRTSVEQFRGSTKSLPEIAKTLGVNFILEGSVQRYDNKVRVNVQLIDCRHDRQILSEKYDREFVDIFAIRSDIAKLVADQLQAALSPNEIKEIEKIPTQNTEAYNLYLKGRFFWNKRTETDLRKSKEYFEKAIATDPDYATAYAGLADAYFIQAYWGWIDKEEGYSQAKKFARKSIDLDPNLSEAHATLGGVLCWGEWKWEDARKELLAAIEMNPHYSTAHQYYSELLNIMGKQDEALDQINMALEFDPYSTLLNNLKSRYYYRAGKLEESLMVCQSIKEINPDNSNYSRLMYIYFKLGKDSCLIETFKQIIEKDTLQISVKSIYEMYSRSKTDCIMELWLDSEMKKMKPDIVKLARLNALLGNKNEALTYLEKALKARSSSLPNIYHDPDFEILYDEPCFQALLDSMGLSEYQ